MTDGRGAWAVDALAIARTIAMQAKIGKLSYDEGKKMATPYLDIANTKIAEMAKKHGKRPFKVGWTGLVR